MMKKIIASILFLTLFNVTTIGQNNLKLEILNEIKKDEALMVKATYTNYTNKTQTLNNNMWQVHLLKDSIYFYHQPKNFDRPIYQEVKIRKGKSHIFIIPVYIQQMKSADGQDCENGKYELIITSSHRELLLTRGKTIINIE
ncbi:MAG: hypothetical protein E6767_14380 [Dysgonomonas sp.]|nr:hypothetical protein [Dysgonomonas sp.]